MAWPLTRDELVAAAMQPLVERGRATLAAIYAQIPEADRPIGFERLAIVLRVDFVAHPELCLLHTTVNERTIYILQENGTFCALLSRLSPK